MPVAANPSSGASRHLLPSSGEKDIKKKPVNLAFTGFSDFKTKVF
jgi:hypothetical protein